MTPIAPYPPAHLPAWAALLESFYSRAALPMPQLRQLKGEEVPQPYKNLLVHSSDMTPTLENFYQQPLGLTVLSRDLHDDNYLREVVLKLVPTDKPVAYGVIRICLGQLPPPARRRVLEEEHPLGNILLTEGIAHLSWPQAFLCVEADDHMKKLLGLPQAGSLYGRRNVLLDGSRHLLAEVIEILAPIENHASFSPSNLTVFNDQ